MPRPRVDLDTFRDEIERRIASKHTHRQIRSWLAEEGLTVSKGTLQSRCVAWETTRRTRTAGTNTTLIEAVESVFHTTNHGDRTIADSVAAQGIPTTCNQVGEIRLKNGWRRRANNEDQLAEMRAETFALTKHPLASRSLRLRTPQLILVRLRHVAVLRRSRVSNLLDGVALQRIYHLSLI
jgi:hypothetical protein